MLLPLALHFERLTSEHKPKRVKIYSSFAKFDSCHYTRNVSFCIFTPIFFKLMKLCVPLTFNPSQTTRNQSKPVIKFLFKSAATQPFETWILRLLAGECNVSFGTVVWKLEARGVQRCHLFYTTFIVVIRFTKWFCTQIFQNTGTLSGRRDA